MSEKLKRLALIHDAMKRVVANDDWDADDPIEAEAYLRSVVEMKSTIARRVLMHLLLMEAELLGGENEQVDGVPAQLDGTSKE